MNKGQRFSDIGGPVFDGKVDLDVESRAIRQNVAAQMKCLGEDEVRCSPLQLAHKRTNAQIKKAKIEKIRLRSCDVENEQGLIVRCCKNTQFEP